MKASLTCEGLGVPLPTVTWLKDGLQITNNSRKYISTSGTLKVVSTLSFYEVQYKDGGLYTCVFNNTEGSVNSTGIVILYGESVELLLYLPILEVFSMTLRLSWLLHGYMFHAKSLSLLNKHSQ